MIQLTKTKKYQSSHISTPKLHQLWWKFHKLIESDKNIWQQPPNISKLCQQLNTNQKYLSQTINQATGLTIVSLFHCYRIKRFLQKLENGEAQLKTMEGLLNETGFQNRSSFYTAFRKTIGCTVSEMLTQINQKKNMTCP